MKIFHHITKLLFEVKRGRPSDILLAISFIMTRVKAPTEDDLKKLIHVLP